MRQAGHSLDIGFFLYSCPGKTSVDRKQCRAIMRASGGGHASSSPATVRACRCLALPVGSICARDHGYGQGHLRRGIARRQCRSVLSRIDRGHPPGRDGWDRSIPNSRFKTGGLHGRVRTRRVCSRASGRARVGGRFYGYSQRRTRGRHDRGNRHRYWRVADRRRPEHEATARHEQRGDRCSPVRQNSAGAWGPGPRRDGTGRIQRRWRDRVPGRDQLPHRSW